MKLYNDNYKYLICDSLDAFKYFKNKIKYTKLLSASPALIFKKKTNAISVYEFWNTRSFKDFQKSIFDHNKEIYFKLNTNQNISKAENLVTNIAISNFQKIIFKIACISNIKEEDNCLLITHKNNNSCFKYTENPWEKIFIYKRNIKILEYKDCKNSSRKFINEFSDNINLIQRIFFAGIETINYRFFRKIIYFLLFFKKKKNLICLNENELLIETASKFIKNRYKVIELSKIKPLAFQKKIKNSDIIYNLCRPLIKKRLNEWTEKTYHKAALNIFKNILKEQLNSYWQWQITFENFFSNNTNLKYHNTILFCNAPSNPKCLAAKTVVNKINIPLIAFQHGVSAEISNSHEYNKIFHDTSSSDIFISFNKNSSKVANKNIFSRALIVSYRGSKRFNRVKNVYFKKERNSILYLSNNLYKGNFGSLATWTTDQDMANNEMKLINLILKKIKRTIFYKPYPEINRRYYDIDPAINHIKNQSKIKLISNNIDARYMLNNYEIIMCGSATSTLSWALLSNKPLIFINYEKHASLTKDAYNYLKESVFLFDFDSVNFKKKIVDFSNLKIDEINHKWHLKKKKRDFFINNFITNLDCKINIYDEINKNIKIFHDFKSSQ